MALVHDASYSIGDIYTEIFSNLYDYKIRWFTEVDVLNSLQDQYNKIVAILCPIERTTLIPQLASPYYPIRKSIPDFMYVSGIFNPITNRWLEGISYKEMKIGRLSSLHGNHRSFYVMDLHRLKLWPFNTTASSVLFLVYKAAAPTISMSHVPTLPHSIGARLLEIMSTADLLEQAREFTKASLWWSKVYTAAPGQKSLMDQAAAEIKNLVRFDKELVLEPYRWLFHSGTGGVNLSWINNETPSGTIDGVNAVFTVAAAPSPTASLILNKNGQIMVNGEGYTLSGQTITYNTNFIPQAGDVHRVWYQIG